jgi:hypothetical protein
MDGRVLAAAALIAMASSRPGLAEEGAPPPLADAETVRDDQERVELSLPAARAVKERPPGVFEHIATWSVDFDGQPPREDGFVHVESRMAFGRAVLAGTMGSLLANGRQLPESLHADDTSWIEERTDETNRFLVRAVEHADTVYFVSVQVREADWGRWKDHAYRIARSLRGLKGFEPPATPDGYARLDTDVADVWSDAKKSDVTQLLRSLGACREAARKLFQSQPAWGGAPRVVLCGSTEAFAEMWFTPSEFTTLPWFHNGVTRSFCVDLSKRTEPTGVGEFEGAAGLVLIQQHFGGPVPPWFSRGLDNFIAHGAGSGGKFEPAPAALLRNAKAAALTGNRPLSALLELTTEPRERLKEFGCESYAWHYFFRFGAGQKAYGDRYRACLDVLRKTGDVREARAVWKTVDGAKLHRAFLDWLTTWKETKTR